MFTNRMVAFGVLAFGIGACSLPSLFAGDCRTLADAELWSMNGAFVKCCEINTDCEDFTYVEACDGPARSNEVNCEMTSCEFQPNPGAENYCVGAYSYEVECVAFTINSPKKKELDGWCIYRSTCNWYYELGVGFYCDYDTFLGGAAGYERCSHDSNC